jgi:hypothetical protein
MDVFQTNEAPNVIPACMSISDMTRVLESGLNQNSAEMRWRWAVLDVMKDAMQIICATTKKPQNLIWREEARLRATSFLRLALVDSYGTTALQNCASRRKWNSQPVLRLARCYRSLNAENIQDDFDSRNVIRDVFVGLAATYRPVIKEIDFEISANSVKVGHNVCRALALFVSWATQRLLDRAARQDRTANARLTLNFNNRSMASLLFEANDSIWAFLDPSDLAIGSGLAESLQAEFVCRHGGRNGHILELRFPPGHLLD